jgi:serine/threonine-protein kinase
VPVADPAGLNDAPGAFDAQADAAEEKRLKKHHRRREAAGALLALFWMIVSAGMLGGILYGAYYAWMENSPKPVRVPAYVGKSRDEAARILSSQGLKMGVRSTRYDPKKPEGTVLSGDQPAGKEVKQGREILVTVSQGPQPVRVLDFRELTVQRARQIISRQGMTLGQIAERYDSRVPRGYVCDQFPQPGETVSPAEPINLVVSKGRQPPVEAPDADNLTTVPGRPAVPPQLAPDEDDLDQANPDEAPDATLVSRSVRVKVDVPQDGATHTVQVEVNDENGQKTIYNRTHKPGDIVTQTVRVTRRQGTVATVRVYLDDELLVERRV